MLPLALASSACVVVIGGDADEATTADDAGGPPTGDDGSGSGSGSGSSGEDDIDGTATATTGDPSDDGSGDADATATATATSEDGSDDSCLFLPCTDMPDPGPGCDPFAQNCPAGEKCMPISEGPNGPWLDAVCSPILGEGLLGDPCSLTPQEAIDDCAAGLFCWQGSCTAFCKGSLQDPLCAGQTSCEVIDALPLCLGQCDPLAQDCGPEQGCWWTSEEFTCANSSLDIPTGQPCGFINDCVVGDVCLGADLLLDCDGASCCASFCSLSDPNACAGQPNLACVSFFEMGQAPAGFEDVGACMLP